MDVADDDLQIHRLERCLAAVGRDLGLGKQVRDEAWRWRWRFSKNEHRKIVEEYERRQASKRSAKSAQRRAARVNVPTLGVPSAPPPPRRSKVSVENRPRDPLDIIEDALFRVALLLTEAATEVHKHAQYMRASRMEWEAAEREQAALDDARELEYERSVVKAKT